MAFVYLNWRNRKIRVHRPDCKEAQGDRPDTGNGLWAEYESVAIAFQVATACGQEYGYADVRGCQKCALISN
jgi:hypothetical protein